MVAGGGGGCYGTLTSCIGGGSGGGLKGYDASTSNGYGPGFGATQISGGAAGVATTENLTGQSGTFGIGGSRGTMAGGGGGGYYGGGGSAHIDASGGGSSYISGHTGCVAITSSGTPKSGCDTETTDNSCSIHYSDKVLIDTLMIDGSGYTWTNEKAATAGTNLMPNPRGGNYASGGNTGDGYAKITFVGTSYTPGQ